MAKSEPLWRVVQRADSLVASDYQSPEARVIRAIADEIKCHPEANRCTEWGDVADWLRSEADRAEAGE